MAVSELSSLVKFNNYEGTYSGLGADSRMWRITASPTGWRLEFRDAGDKHSTYAGTHTTLGAAQREASR